MSGSIGDMHTRIICLLLCSALALPTAPAASTAKADPALVALAAGLTIAGKDWPSPPATGKQELKLPELGSDQARALLGVPEKYTHDQAWPLWIVLHGGPGGRPEDLASVFRAGLMEQGCICIFPQALNVRLLEWNYPDEGLYLLRLIAAVGKRYHLDTTRIYLAGHSMGGGGTWANGALMSDVFAGLGPMSGWAVPTPMPDFAKLKAMPIYCIHGDADVNVPVELSRMAMKKLEEQKRVVNRLATLPADDTAMKALLGSTLVYRELPGVPHNIFQPWKELGAPEIGCMVTWMNKQKRAKPADTNAALANLLAWGKQFGWSPTPGPLGAYADEESAPKKRK